MSCLSSFLTIQSLIRTNLQTSLRCWLMRLLIHSFSWSALERSSLGKTVTVLWLRLYGDCYGWSHVVVSCFILEFCPHVSCFAFHFLPLSLFGPYLCCVSYHPLVYLGPCLPLSLCQFVCSVMPSCSQSSIVWLRLFVPDSSHCFLHDLFDSYFVLFWLYSVLLLGSLFGFLLLKLAFSLSYLSSCVWST